MPFKHNAARRHHISKARYRVTNWPAYEAALELVGAPMLEQLLAQGTLQVAVAQEHDHLGPVLLAGSEERPPFAVRVAVE